MQDSHRPHALLSKNGRNLDHGLDVIRRVEEGEATREDSQENDTDAPNVDLGRLLGALEQNLWGAESSGPCAIRSPGRASVLFGIAVVWCTAGVEGRTQSRLTGYRVVVANTVGAIATLTLGQTKVDQNTTSSGRVVEKIGGFNITVQNGMGVDTRQRRKQRSEVDGNIRDCHLAEVFAEIGMAEVW